MPPYKGLLLQHTYRVRQGRPVVLLFGRLETGPETGLETGPEAAPRGHGDTAPRAGPAFLIEDDRFRPYFFVRERDRAALGDTPEARLEPTALCDLAGQPVLRVVVAVPAVVPALRARLARAGVQALEADLRFPTRYLIDHGLGASLEIEGEPDATLPGLLRFQNPELRPARCRPPLRVLSIDLETSPDASRIFSAAFAGCGTEESHVVTSARLARARSHPDERQLLAAVAARVRELDPDVLVGWNVVDFDLRVWARRAAALGLRADLGRGPGELGFHQDASFTRQTRADLPGRVVLDALALARDALRLEDYRLDTAARAVLGRGKRMDAETPDAAAEIARLHREDPEELAAYNLEDARLVLEILEREGLLEGVLERSLLSGMPLDRVGASIASFDRLYLPELRGRGVVAPSVEAERKATLVRGGAVLDAQPGLFRNVAAYDFKSLYPSLIRTFQLDPLAHARAPMQGGEEAIVAPNGARFARQGAILPGIIERFIAQREEARRRGDAHADQAIKIMTNALFGVLGAAACRFFDADVANAITGFGQQTLGWTREAFEGEGVPVLYGDTDSVFVALGDAADPSAARECAVRLRERVAARIGERVRREYRVEPKLFLELQHVFERFYLPRVRGGTSGSKKRYAGWRAGRLHVVGLEAVRRDWPAIARRLQEGMLERVFTDREVLCFVRELVESVLAGERDAELVTTRRVRKGSLERYTATTPPHVVAARKGGAGLGPLVRYVITTGGPEPVLPGRPLPAAIDRRHYVERVLRPVGQSILAALGHDFDEALGQPHQLPLL